MWGGKESPLERSTKGTTWDHELVVIRGLPITQKRLWGLHGQRGKRQYAAGGEARPCRGSSRKIRLVRRLTRFMRSNPPTGQETICSLTTREKGRRWKESQTFSGDGYSSSNRTNEQEKGAHWDRYPQAAHRTRSGPYHPHYYGYVPGDHTRGVSDFRVREGIPFAIKWGENHEFTPSTTNGGVVGTPIPLSATPV